MLRPGAKYFLLALLLSGAVAAQDAAPAKQPRAGGKPDTKSTLNEMRPSGPVTVKADHVEWVQDSTMKYTGKVSLDSDTLTLRGDTMDIKQAADGSFEATVVGAPGTLDHQPQPDATGVAAQPVHANASQLHYNSATGTVDLTGEAHLQRGTDEVHGATIGYEVPERRVRASGGDQGQVTITFTPPAKSAPPPAKKPEPKP